MTSRWGVCNYRPSPERLAQAAGLRRILLPPRDVLEAGGWFDSVNQLFGSDTAFSCHRCRLRFTMFVLFFVETNFRHRSQKPPTLIPEFVMMLGNCTQQFTKHVLSELKGKGLMDIRSDPVTDKHDTTPVVRTTRAMVEQDIIVVSTRVFIRNGFSIPPASW
jgi:hypothetical protein